jgi:hypothetical protein
MPVKRILPCSFARALNSYHSWFSPLERRHHGVALRVGIGERLRREDHLVAPAAERAAQRLLGGAVAVALRRVEVRDAAGERVAHELVVAREAARSEAHVRHLEAGAAELHAAADAGRISPHGLRGGAVRREGEECRGAEPEEVAAVEISHPARVAVASAARRPGSGAVGRGRGPVTLRVVAERSGWRCRVRGLSY